MNGTKDVAWKAWTMEKPEIRVVDARARWRTRQNPEEVPRSRWLIDPRRLSRDLEIKFVSITSGFIEIGWKSVKTVVMPEAIDFGNKNGLLTEAKLWITRAMGSRDRKSVRSHPIFPGDIRVVYQRLGRVYGFPWYRFLLKLFRLYGCLAGYLNGRLAGYLNRCLAGYLNGCLARSRAGFLTGPLAG